MNTPSGVMEVINTLQMAGYEAYLVGGCVRDQLMGREPKDYDITTSATPVDVHQIFDKVVDTGIDFGTVTVLIPGAMGVEITTYRGDGVYTDGRRPNQVKFGVNLKDDLARRDFTMNAIAYDPVSCEFMDPFEGRLDISRKLIRAVGDPWARFNEDYLRVLRAIRFSITLDFDLHPETAAAVEDMVLEGKLIGLPAERRWQEFLKILIHPNVRGLEDVLNVWPPVRDAFCLDNDYNCALIFRDVERVPPSPMLRLAHLMQDWSLDMVEKRLRELKLSGDTIRTVPAIIKVKWHVDDNMGQWSADVRDMLAMCAEERVDPIWIEQLLVAEGRGPYAERIQRVRATFPPVKISDLAVNGNDLQKLGLRGRELGLKFRQLLHVVIDEPSMNTKEKLLGLVSNHT